MATGNAILKNGGISTLAATSLGQQTSVPKLKLRHMPFIPWSDI